MNNNFRQLNVNPADLIQMIKSGQNPQQLMLKIFESNLSASNPVAANLVELAKQNRTADIEKIARNLCAERGIDFDKEFNNFKSNLFKIINSK
jgi:hypothetical protein